MAPSPQKLREVVLLLLYSFDKEGDGDERAILDLVTREAKISKSSARQSLETAKAIRQQLSSLDEKISSHLKDYSLERVHDVDRQILRIGVYELSQNELSAGIIISEARRLAKKYSTPEASAFVNGVLDALAHKEGDAS